METLIQGWRCEVSPDYDVRIVLRITEHDLQSLHVVSDLRVKDFQVDRLGLTIYVNITMARCPILLSWSIGAGDCDYFLRAWNYEAGESSSVVNRFKEWRTLTSQ